MRFGKSAAEAATEAPRGGGGGDFIRYLKEGDTTLRLLQEPSDWLYYWEHFSPAGFSFPCNNEDDCPGCSSDNEKMKKVNRRIAFNVLNSFNGQEYVNAFKVGPTVADKLENRYKRFGTVTDRDFTISKYKSKADRWDFDVEGHSPAPVDLSRYELKDIEAMLQASWDENWGDPVSAQLNTAQTKAAGNGAAPKRATIAPTPKQDDEPPFEEKVYQEADLRQLDYEALLVLIKGDLEMTPPDTLTTTDAVVDWLMELQS